MATILDVLNTLKIPYRTSGRNIGKNWVGTRCINCGDNRNHFGINLRTGHCHCWSCGKSLSIQSFLFQSGIPYQTVKVLLAQVELGQPNRNQDYHQDNMLPAILNDFVSPLPREYRDYFESRQFDPDLIQRKYFLMAPKNNIGKFKFRAIIPVVMKKETVGFFGRDITGRAYLKYLLSDESVNLIPRREWIFNIDSVSKTNGKAVIVEGTLDAMKVGDGALAVLSTSFSKAQLDRIVSLKLKKIFVMFDNEPRATEKAYRLANYLAPFCDVEVITDTEWDDPGAMTAEQVKYFRKEIF